VIHSVTTPTTGVILYDCKHDSKDLVELIEAESRRPWSHLPFTTGWTDERETTSEFAALAPVVSAETGPLLPIGKLAHECNTIIEDCLHDYMVQFGTDCSMDDGLTLYKITGKNNYSAPITAPNGLFNMSCFMAISEVQMKLDRFEIEMTVDPGAVYILPSQFPYEHSILGTPNSIYLLGKHLKA
jgi:hypothetical protein